MDTSRIHLESDRLIREEHLDALASAELMTECPLCSSPVTFDDPIGCDQTGRTAALGICLACGFEFIIEVRAA